MLQTSTQQAAAVAYYQHAASSEVAVQQNLDSGRHAILKHPASSLTAGSKQAIRGASAIPVATQLQDGREPPAI